MFPAIYNLKTLLKNSPTETYLLIEFSYQIGICHSVHTVQIIEKICFIRIADNFVTKQTIIIIQLESLFVIFFFFWGGE